MNQRGYSLIEVVIAGALLVIGIAAAGLFAHTMLLQQEASSRVAMAFNMQEQSARLFQLGLAPSAITNILPARVVGTGNPNADQISLQFTVVTNTVAGAGDVEQATITMVFPAARQTDGTLVLRTNSVTAVRPTTLR